MARLFAKALGYRIAPLGIVVGQFPILVELWLKDGVTQKELLSKIERLLHMPQRILNIV